MNFVSGERVASEHAVVIAGAGPTGMMLAGELALAGVAVAIVERRVNAELIGARSRGLHARTLEVLDQRGIADRFLAEGKAMQVGGFAHVPLDISEFPARHSYGLALCQRDFERILAGWVEELGVVVYRGREVTGFAQDESGVDIALSDGDGLHARYLVGCDGGRSVSRKAAGIAFPGWDATVSHLLAEVEFEADPKQEPEWGMRYDEAGLHSLSKAEGGRVSVLVTEREIGGKEEPTLRDLSEALVRVYGTDYGVRNPAWISRFTDAARQAERYRDGRVLLAGDAAHIHYPAGGQGLNLGVQDAVNLGWKLAQVVKGTSPETLLESYQAERHPVAARVLRNSLAQVALLRRDDRSKAAWEVVSELLKLEEARKRMAGEMSGLSIRYDFGEGHPLLGRRMPDLDLGTAEGPLRVFSLLHGGRAVVLNFGAHGDFEIGAWGRRVQRVDAVYEGPWELPVVGWVPAPKAVLVRPDGYVAWVGDGAEGGLTEALTTWFGPPAAA
jgi:2-polyprenyl-6-methoxyphenol hydroxylase-like FAD-dependent oxidoreductase